MVLKCLHVTILVINKWTLRGRPILLSLAHMITDRIGNQVDSQLIQLISDRLIRGVSF